MYSKEGGKVRCILCPHNCLISEGKRGICMVRENNFGVLNSLVYGVLSAAHIDPIEKKPLFHYKPGSNSYSIATVGCNLRCEFCQNWDLSQGPKTGKVSGKKISPKEVVEQALENDCESISFTYSEPTIFLEFAKDVGELARSEGLGNVFVSNGFMSKEAFDETESFLDAANIDIKSFSEGFYEKYCGGRLKPVLDTCKRMVERGVWLEVTTLIIPGLNDSEKELSQIASFICDELGDGVPWHVSRFHPDYKLTDIPPTPMESILRAVELGRDAGLKFVYSGNTPYGEYENTNCPKCGLTLVERVGYSIYKKDISSGTCPECSTRIEGFF